jgi:hypothetical protein
MAATRDPLRRVPPLVIPGPPYEEELRIWGRSDPAGYLALGFGQSDGRTFVKRARRLEETSL